MLTCIFNTTSLVNANSSLVIFQAGEFDWSPSVQSQLLASFYYCYLILQLPAGYIAGRYGAKWVVFVCGLIPGILYLLVPVIARTSVYALIAIQVISGLFQVSIFTRLHTILS